MTFQLIGYGALAAIVLYLFRPQLSALIPKLPTLKNPFASTGGGDPRRAAIDKYLDTHDFFHEQGLHNLCDEMEKLLPKMVCLHPEHQHEAKP